jgi:hypothetical protein
MMEELLLFLLIAVIMIILIPVFPRMIRFRIKVLRILKWNSLAAITRPSIQPPSPSHG